MKIAVASTGPTLDDNVEARFGRCPYFLIIDTDTMQLEAIENPNMALGGGMGRGMGQGGGRGMGGGGERGGGRGMGMGGDAMVPPSGSVQAGGLMPQQTASPSQSEEELEILKTQGQEMNAELKAVNDRIGQVSGGSVSALVAAVDADKCTNCGVCQPVIRMEHRMLSISNA